MIRAVSIVRDSAHPSGMSSDSSWRRDRAHFHRRADEPIDHRDAEVASIDCTQSFVREKFVWLDQVRADRELTPIAFMLAYVLANLVNAREGFAWPSVARLAAECRVTKRGAQKIVARLVERGHLSVEFGIGRGETNRYRWIVRSNGIDGTIEQRPGERRPSSAVAKARQESCHLDQKGRTPVLPNQAERVNRRSEKGERLFEKGRTPVHPTLLKESIYDPIYRLSSQRHAQSPPIGFADFWRVYPKKVARSAAFDAYIRAVHLATPDELIRGAIRYAAERHGEDPRYTKNPATWLNKGCWSEATPPRERQAAGVNAGFRFPTPITAQGPVDDDLAQVLNRIQQQRKRD